MKKEEYIKRHGIKAYEKKLQQTRDWGKWHRKEKKDNSQKWAKTHPEESREIKRLWKRNHPDKVKEGRDEYTRKGGKHYESQLKYFSKGVPHERKLVRGKHGRLYTPYKKIIAPDSQIHHEWIPETGNYKGVALVEKDQHMHGFIDVIQILEGKLTLFTEEEIRMCAKPIAG